MTDRVQEIGGNSPDYQLMFLGDTSGVQAIEDGQTLIWNEAQARFVPGSPGVSLGYSVWRGLLSQSGANPPVATVLENSLVGDIVWSYHSPGVYIGTLIGGFPMGHFFFPLDGQRDVDLNSFGLTYLSDDTISVFCVDSVGDPADDLLNSQCTFEIRIYDEEGVIQA